MKRSEAVLVIIKPDGIYKHLEGDIFNKFAAAGLQMVAVKVAKPSRALVEKHYKHIRTEPFFKSVVEYLLGKYHRNTGVVAVVYYGPGAIKRCRDIAGTTNPEDAKPHTIRAAFGRITTRGVYENVVHVSSDRKEAEHEIKLWFRPDDILVKLYPEKTGQPPKQRMWI